MWRKIMDYSQSIKLSNKTSRTSLGTHRADRSSVGQKQLANRRMHVIILQRIDTAKSSRISGEIVDKHWAALQLVVSRAVLAASERHMQLSPPLNLLSCHTRRGYDTQPCQRG
jgi:hypothetical protein